MLKSFKFLVVFLVDSSIWLPTLQFKLCSFQIPFLRVGLLESAA